MFICKGYGTDLQPQTAFSHVEFVKVESVHSLKYKKILSLQQTRFLVSQCNVRHVICILGQNLHCESYERNYVYTPACSQSSTIYSLIHTPVHACIHIFNFACFCICIGNVFIYLYIYIYMYKVEIHIHILPRHDVIAKVPKYFTKFNEREGCHKI